MEVGKGSPTSCYLNSDGSVRETQIGVDRGSLPGTEDSKSGASDCVRRPAVACKSQREARHGRSMKVAGAGVGGAAGGGVGGSGLRFGGGGTPDGWDWGAVRKGGTEDGP